ncbi:MAG: hypothetical protein JWP12_2875 [Bacteroidetes bacterium]|nr:hypothetical protein [Bacteroidota bacterium]
MSSTSVYNALNGYITNGTIDLWAAANGSAELTGMVPVLGLFNISASYPLTAVILTQSANNASVRLTGQGSFVGGVTYPVNAALQYLGSDNSFSLTLTVKTAWVFSDFFPELPQTLMQDPAITPGITWYPSVLNGMKVTGAVFTGITGATLLTLTGFLQEPTNEYLLEKTPMIGPWPLRLSGTIGMPTSQRTYPLIDADARGNNTIIEGKKVEGVDGPSSVSLINPGLTLVVQPLVPPQAGNNAFSTIELFGDFALGEITGRISTLILSTGETWNFVVRFNKETASLVQGLAQLTRIFGVELPIPMDFPVLSDFYVAEIDIDLHNSAAPGNMPSFSLEGLAITIRSDTVWNPPIPFVTFSNVGTRWVWGWTTISDGSNIYSLTGSVFGTINFGGSGGSAAVARPRLPRGGGGPRMMLDTDGNPVSLRVGMTLPEFIISGQLTDDSYIPIGEALNYFFGNTGPSTGSQQMNVTKLQFTADPIGQNYFANASIFFGDPTNPDPQQGWEINLFIITIILQQLEFEIAVNNGSVSGAISGTFFLVQGNPSDYTLPRIIISAEYPPQDPETPAGWTLSGYLYPGTSIDLSQLVYQFIYGEQEQAPDWIPVVSVDRLAASFTTGSTVNGVTTNPSYTFGGTVSLRWTPTIFQTTLQVNASASVDLEKTTSSDTATGKITGTFSVNKIMITASLTFGVPEPTYLFKVQFDELWLQATTSWRDNPDKQARHQVVSLQLGGVTLGDILEYLVNLAAPTIGFSLDPPWDVLKKVDLSRFVLTIDPKYNIVEFVFNANVNLVIAQVDSIGVRYSKENGEGKVNLILTGSFLGQQYTDNDPLTWDVVNDPPPAVPGQGKSLVNLRYIGIGQRVTFPVGFSPNTVAEAIDGLRTRMTPPPDTGSPMPGSMRYSADSQWLIGLDLQLMETIDLGFIFNDPVLYGLSIALGGEKAGSLAGLRFEILYKKITDEIGMFRIEFQVPDMFRTIQLGVVSITLGIIVIEIYTNGNFKIDLGFPYNQDFSRSFSLQAYIFIGRGGFYFGVLNGDTSTQVPTISNGNFSPVIELGIGIAAGVGREIRAGILSGGAYVELQVIFQGVLAWFNPNSSGAPSATYFKCQGIAALHGKIYGSVDFVVVKVSVTLEAYAQISIIYESYQPMLITLSASVRAEASIKILFIRVHFSFSVKLEISFTVGSAQPTPWILSNNTSSGNQPGLTGISRQRNGYALRTNPHRRLQAMRKTYHADFMSALLRTDGNSSYSIDLSTTYILQWKPADKVFTDAPRKAHLTLLPVFTIAGVPVNWDGTVPVNTTPDYRTAFVLFADSGIDVSASTAKQCAVRSAAHSAMTSSDEDTSLLAADILTQGLLQYAIDALPRSSSQGNYITAHDISLLLEQLDLPEAMADGLSIDSLQVFFSTNINLWISGDTDPRPDEKSAMVLPMPPFLRWTSAQGGDVDFSTENEVGPWYEWRMSQWLSRYFPVSGEESEEPENDVPADYESFTSFMFRDFCMMVIQNAVTEMQKHMNNTTVTVITVSGVVQNLNEVATGLPTTIVSYTIQSGDTIDSVAANLGATVEELEFLNPTLIHDLGNAVGTALSIKLGVAPEVLALDNADEVFAVTQCTLGTLVHQAAVDETLQGIATLFQVASVSTLLEYQDPILPALSAASNILKADAAYQMTAQVFSNPPADFVKLRTAAAFYIRYTDFIDTAIPGNAEVANTANWYVQVITEINQTLLQTLFPNQLIPSVVELPPGQQLTVPNAYGVAYTQTGTTNTYTTINGDTLNTIGYTLALQQDYAASGTVPQWQTFQDGVTPATGGGWNIKEWAGVKIDVAQTFESLVRRMVVDATWTPVVDGTPTEGTWSYDWTNVARWTATANILLPLASVTVPDAKTTVSSELSFTVISKTYGLTVTDAAARLKNVSNLYASGTVLLVKLLPAQDIDVLIAQILQGDSFAAIVNQSSRMLMSGLQLPGLKEENGHVVPDEANPLPIYDLTGQQFSITVDDSQPTAVALALSLFSEQTWIELFNSITVQEGDTLASLEALYPDLLEYNPGLNEETFKVGMVLLTAPVTTSLDYSYTNADIAADSPAAGLAIQPVPPTDVAPSILPVSGTVPRTYGLDHRVELQTPVTIPIPVVAGEENVTGNPGMWVLPAELQTKAQAGTLIAYEVLAAPLGGEAGAVATQIDNSTFGTMIPFKIKRLNGSSSEFNLIGVDTDKRSTLITLSNWLRVGTNSTNTVSYQLLSPSPDAANTSGVTVLTAAAADAYLIKSNLSTLSVPPSMMLREAVGGGSGNVYYASMNELADFLMLLWEGSVVGGTGYYFSPGQDLPGSAIDQQGNITLQLLVIAGTQQSVESGGRKLLAFNNCVLIGPGNENTQLSVFIQSAGSIDPSETVTQALMPPGNVGFELVLDNPETQSASFSADEIMLKTLYSLLCYEVAETAGSPFAADASGLPVLPNPTKNLPGQAWEKARNARKALRAGLVSEDEDDVLPYWQYSQVMPVSRFIIAGTAIASPAVLGLPLPAGDPYQGYGTQTQMPSASFVFTFGDVLGNRTGANATGTGATSVPVGYTDNMIGVGDWPSTARYYNVLPSGLGAQLSVYISPRPSEMLPTPSQSGTVNADQVVQQRDQFAQAYYQLVQPQINGWIVSSLNYVTDANFGNKGIAIGDISPLWKFAVGSYAVFSGLTQMTATSPANCNSLGDILTQYGVRNTELAQANADTLLPSLFGASLPVVPAYYPFVEHQSISQLYNMPPTGWPKPATDEDLLTMPENTGLLLKAGSSMVIPQITISTGATEPSTEMLTLANNNHTTVYDLAITNALQPVLEMGFEFKMEVDDVTEVVVTVDATTNSFDLVVKKYATLGVNTTVAALAALHSELTGMFAVNQSLFANTYLIQEGDKLETNSSGVSVATLATLNVDTPDLFDPGALIYFGNFSNVSMGSTIPTLQEFADRYACPADLLLDANAGLVLPQGTQIVVPGTLSWPTSESNMISIPYTILSGDTLNAVALRFNYVVTTASAALQLATVNQNMPGTIVPGIVIAIPVGGTTYNVNTGTGNPSFASVLVLLQAQAPTATLADLVNGMGATTGVLDPGGLFICPPAKFAQATAPETILATYGVTPASFALANVAMENLIGSGYTLYNVAKMVSVVTQANDTFNSIISRFAEQHVTISANEIIMANLAETFIAAGALAFIPPAEISFTANMGSGGPYLSPIVPLQVSLRLLRPEALINTYFKTATGTGSVEMTESDFPPPVNNTSADSGLTLNAFVAEMKLALPDLRIATAKVNGVKQDLWQINFDSNGIKEVELVGGTQVNNVAQPRFFALLPLYQFLVTRTISVAPLSSNGNLGTAQEIAFQSIDVELWARRFVEDMDRFLSGPYATAVYGDTTIRTQLDAVLDAKETLIPEIAAGLDTVLAITDPGKQAGLESAQESLEQQLGVSLAKTYEATVLIQYNSTVDSSWQTDPSLEPASLYGDGSIVAPGSNSMIPGLTMIAAKTDLSQASDFVNFLMILDNPAFHRDVSGMFGYALSHLEFNISGANMPGDYKSSDWLTFVPLQAGAEKPSALSGTDPGTVDVPVPLRNFPDLPKIVQQQANQNSPDGTQDVSQLSKWDYEFIYSHQHAEQDYVVITAQFNLTTPDMEARAEDNPRDLFTELAQYITVADELWNMLNSLTAEVPAFPPADIENAVRTYASLVTNVADYWSTRLPQEAFATNPTDQLVAGQTYFFNARVQYRTLVDTTVLVDTLTLTTPGNQQPGPNNTWPEGWVWGRKVDAEHPETESPEMYHQMTLVAGTGSAVYTVPSDIVVLPSWPEFRLVWKELNVGVIQNARSQMNVLRNQNLLDNVPTNPDFLFTTDTVVAASVVTPLNNFGTRVDITSLGANLTDALNACFTDLFGTQMNGQKITMGLSYGFELVAPSPPDPGLITYLPIGLYPNQTLSANTAAGINTAITSWQTTYQPVETGGEWVFSLKLYSQYTDETQTLMNIETLVYRMSQE